MSAWFALSLQNNLPRLVSVACLVALGSPAYGFPASHAASRRASKTATTITCGSCHSRVAADFALAPMGHAMERQGANPALEGHPKLTYQLGGYSYSVETKDGQSTYTVTDGTATMTLPIQWIFGQHSQTWVFEKDGHFYEGLVSYYPRGETLGITPGDGRVTPHTLTEAMGRELAMWETRQCFNCHATDAVTENKLTLSKLRPGVACERCHIGAVQHMADAARNDFNTLPKALGRLPADDISTFCGQCHRTWETVVRNHWRGEAFVRFQPYRLENSRCFDGSDKRISCVACHDPHQPANRDDAFYDSKCLACHGQAKTATASTAAKSCPVAAANCVSCHMPKVNLPGGHLRFTDHEIRIVHPGDAYPN